MEESDWRVRGGRNGVSIIVDAEVFKVVANRGRF